MLRTHNKIAAGTAAALSLGIAVAAFATVPASAATILHPGGHGQAGQASAAGAPDAATTTGQLTNRAQTNGPRAGGGGRGGFTLDCAYSHSAAADPIVMPGMAGMSHLHDFFGNTGTNESSTGQTLLTGSTTCNDSNNKSAYWVPALYQDGVEVAPARARVRYAGGRGVTAFPVGFAAVTGRTDQTAAWACAVRGQRPQFGTSVATVPTCDANSRLVARVTFPDCWDGTSLDSSNHISHLANSTQVDAGRSVCPDTHPVRVPAVTIEVEYPAAVTGGPGVTLASGAASTLHADIFEAWSGTSLQDRLGSPAGGQQGGTRPPRNERPLPPATATNDPAATDTTGTVTTAPGTAGQGGVQQPGGRPGGQGRDGGPRR